MFVSLSRADIIPYNSSLVSGNGHYWSTESFPSAWDSVLYTDYGYYIMNTDEEAPNNIYFRDMLASTSSAWTWVSRIGSVLYTSSYANKNSKLYLDRGLTTPSTNKITGLEKLYSSTDLMTSFNDIKSEWDNVLPLAGAINGPKKLYDSLVISTTSPVSGMYAPFVVNIKTNYVANKSGVYTFAAVLRTGAAAMDIAGTQSVFDTVYNKGNSSNIPSDNRYTLCQTQLTTGTHKLTLFYRATVNNSYVGCEFQVKEPDATAFSTLSVDNCYGG